MVVARRACGIRCEVFGYRDGEGKKKTYVNSRSSRHWGRSVLSRKAVCFSEKKRKRKRRIRRQAINCQLALPWGGFGGGGKSVSWGLMRCVVCKFLVDDKVGRYRVFFFPASRTARDWLGGDWGGAISFATGKGYLTGRPQGTECQGCPSWRTYLSKMKVES